MTNKSVNITLSWADWRYLLPNSNPRKSYIHCDGDLADAVEIVSKTATRNGSNNEYKDFDLAAAINPDKHTLKQILSLLKPGGSIYIESTFNPFYSSLSMKKFLESVGFQNINFYLPTTDPSGVQTKHWIPLVENVIVDYISRFHYYKKRKQILKRFSRNIRLWILKLYPRLFVIFPSLICCESQKYKLCSIASKPFLGVSNKNTSQTITARVKEPDIVMTDVITKCLNKLNFNNHPRTYSILILSESIKFNQQLILFVYAEMASKPTFVIKLPRTNIPSLSQKNGITALIALREKFGITEGLPTALYNGYEFGNFITAETFVDGIVLSKKMTDKNFSDLAFKATEWLVQLGEKTKTSSTECLSDGLKENIISNFIKNYGSVLDSEEINIINIVLSDFEPGFRVCAHNDFGPWNIHIDSHGVIGVLDWGSASLNGYPLTDLIMILLWMSFQVKKTYELGEYKQDYLNMLDTSTFTGKVFANCLRHYGEHLGLSATIMPAYRLFTLVLQAQFEFPHLISKMQETNNDTNSINKGFYIQLFKEELQLLSKSGYMNIK